MFALTTVVKSPNGEYRVEDGTLYRLPVELIDPPRVKKYGAISITGWGVSEFGYSYYAKLNSDGGLFIFPGLVIDGETKPTKKFLGYTQKFSRNQIERYADQIITTYDTIRAGAQADLSMLIHDLRRLSTTIYNAAEEAQRYITSENWYAAEERIKNIKAAQAILRIRTDALDFEGNAPEDIPVINVPIYKRVDKVSKCMKPSATEKGITTQLLGPSHNCSAGPDVFEIVPYVLLDNAIKYSNPNSTISVTVEDKIDKVIIRVISEGPLMSNDERGRIFERGVRGNEAIKSGKPGSGLGLFLASRIVREYFNGEIGVTQAAPFSLASKQVQTEFWVELPATQDQHDN